MPTWMEKIKDTFTAKTDLKSLFFVLQPDNQVSTVMVVSYVPTDKDSFQVFMDLTARIAMEQKNIPDNLLLHFEGIPAKDIPFTSELPAKDSEKALRFIASYGGITENNAVPLRKAAYLRACQRELTAENIRDLDYSPAYKCFIAHEDAMEKIAAGKQAKQFYTIAETEQGVRVFNDGLSGTIKFRDYLQSTADNFYSSSLQDVESLNIYRIETVSRRMLELSNGNQTSMPQTGMESPRRSRTFKATFTCPLPPSIMIRSGNLVKLPNAASVPSAFSCSASVSPWEKRRVSTSRMDA